MAKNSDKIHLINPEDFNLEELIHLEGNLLENDKVMSRLEEIKTKSHDISEEVAKSENIMKELETTMNQYSPIANKSSRIFFALDTLETIHYLYRYSLSFFMDVLNFVITSKFVNEIPKTQYNDRQKRIISLLFKEKKLQRNQKELVKIKF